MNDGFVTDTATGIFDVDTMGFGNVPGEIVVDNRDAGFSVKEELRGFFLSKLFAKDVLWEREPQLFCYGDTVRDVCFRKARDRGASGEWRAVLSEKGKYEVFIYNPHRMLQVLRYIEVVDGVRNDKSLVGIPDYIQHYTVYHGTGSDEVELNVRQEEQG